MKRLIALIGVIFLSLFVLTSCGGGKNEITVNLKTTDIKGDLSDYFKVIGGSYKLFHDDKTLKENYYEIKVQLKRSDKEFDFDAVDLESRGYFKIFCDLFDEHNIPIITADRRYIDRSQAQGVNDKDADLAALKPNEIGWAVFYFSGEKEIINKVKIIEIGSKAVMSEARSKSVSYSGEPKVNSFSNNIDCDKFIKEYEEFTNSYIKLLKKYKANPTDSGILSDYSEAAQKATEMQTNASNCTDAKFSLKLLEIANKITKAAL
jgi:hypothetical protein